ncbi:hypothetical protein ACFQGT_09705 [Natrialbaceae archaeon GCM10025810]|uniref:hypothetical protein n=1 Tax=Halovalidus salilacus TaxID=3075124 RepID=UPI00361AEF11
MNKPADYSRAGPGEGVANPKNVSNYKMTRGGKASGLIIRWEGNGYNRDTCWIRASIDDIVSLGENE